MIRSSGWPARWHRARFPGRSARSLVAAIRGKAPARRTRFSWPVLPRLRGDDEARHTLALRIFAQQLGENPLAIEACAAIELVGANGDVATQGRELFLLLLVEADQGAHEVARVAERAFGHALLYVLFQRFRERDVQRVLLILYALPSG
jgi:hypothetical protein